MTFLSNHNEGKATFMKAGKKAKAALCMLLACLCLAGCACAETVTLPDLRDFAGDMQVKITKDEPLERFYRFSPGDDANSVAEAYVAALTEDYSFSLSSDSGESPVIREWCLWIPDSSIPAYPVGHVFIFCSQESGYVDINWADGISMVGSPKKANSSRKECDVCEGSGRCPDCGGERWVTRWEWVTEWVYVNGSPEQTTNSKLVTVRCDGSHCDNGLCSECGGDGWVND